MESKKNLCAPIPESLHQKVRQEQEQRGQTLGEYITEILNEHFEGGLRPMNAAEQEVLRRKMDAFCLDQTGTNLHDYSQQIREEQELSPQLQI